MKLALVIAAYSLFAFVPATAQTAQQRVTIIVAPYNALRPSTGDEAHRLSVSGTAKITAAVIAADGRDASISVDVTLPGGEEGARRVSLGRESRDILTGLRDPNGRPLRLNYSGGAAPGAPRAVLLTITG